MQNIPAAVAETVAFLQKHAIDRPPVVGVVLGSGLGMLAKKMEVIHSFPYNAIPHFAEATVEFHKGHLVYGTIAGTHAIVMQGRFHYYEGYSMQQITFPIRVMKALGVQQLFLSNAAGGINPAYKKGDLVLIEDHLNFLPDNPLRGVNNAAAGQRFVDMAAPYNQLLNSQLKAKAGALKMNLQQGVYAAVMGPNLETRAEYRWLRNTGADMVGMSTVPEVIVANQISLPCAAISVITDECNPDNLQPVNIAEIIEVAGKADEKLSELLVAMIKRQTGRYKT